MSVDLPSIAAPRLVPEPITISTDYSRADRFYRRGVWAVSMGVLVLLFLIGLFLFKSGYPAFKVAGLDFFTRSGFQTTGKHPVFGVLASLVGTLEVAGVAMLVGTPVAIGTALFLSEYAPLWARRPLISMIDLAAAIPSIIFGLWAVFELSDQRGRLQHLAVAAPARSSRSSKSTARRSTPRSSSPDWWSA